MQFLKQILIIFNFFTFFQLISLNQIALTGGVVFTDNTKLFLATSLFILF